jgi:cytochrome c oxidase subunit IV
VTAQARVAAHERRIGRALLAAWWSNLVIWAALLLLLVLSLGLAYLPLGRWNTPIGLAIAALKAALVGYFFMTLRRAPALVLLAIAAGALFTAVMFVLTFNDLFTRF